MPNDPLDSLSDLFVTPKPSDPIARVHAAASRVNVSPEVADDYLNLTGKVESGNRHYNRGGGVLMGPPTRRTGAKAFGMGQVMADRPGGHTRTVGGKVYDLNDPDQNAEAGVRYFAEGGADPVRRRLHYFGGPGAAQKYDRTGKIPAGGDGYTSFQQYVSKSMSQTQGQTPPRRKTDSDPLDSIADLMAPAPQSSGPAPPPAFAEMESLAAPPQAPTTQPLTQTAETPPASTVAPPAPSRQPTGADITHHFGLNQAEWDALNRRQRRQVTQLANQAAIEDEQKRAAGQTDFTPNAQYQNEMRAKVRGLRSIANPNQGQGMGGLREAEGREQKRGMVMGDFRQMEERDARIAREVRPQVIKDYFGMGAGGVRQDIPADVAEQQIAADPRLREYIESETQRRAGALKERAMTVGQVERGAAPILGIKDKVKQLWNEPEQLVPFLSSIPEFDRIVKAGHTADKVAKGEDVTEEELISLREMLAQGKQPKSTLYEVADVLAMLPSFAGEIALTGGIYTAGKEATIAGIRKLATRRGIKIIETKVAERAARRGIGIGLKNVAAKAAGSLAGSAAAAAPAGISRIPTDFTRRIQAGDSFTEALAGAFGNQYIEIASERTGGVLSHIPVPKRLQAIKDAIAARWLKKGRTLPALEDAAKKIGWHGVLGEMFEERVGDVARYAIGEQANPIPTLHQLAVEGLSFSVPGVAMTAATRVAGSTAPRRPVAEPGTVRENTEEGPIQLPAEGRQVIRETRDTLAAQMDAMVNGRGGREAVVIPHDTPAGERPTKIPKGYVATRTEAGTVIHSKDVSPEIIRGRVAKGNTWLMLGHPNPDGPEASRIVVAYAGRDFMAGGRMVKAGTELGSSYVTPGNEQAAIDELRAQHAPGSPYFDVGGNETAEEVIATRTAEPVAETGEGVAPETVAAAPAETAETLPVVEAEDAAGQGKRFATLSNREIDAYIAKARKEGVKREARLAAQPKKGTRKELRQALPGRIERQQRRTATRIAEAEAELDRRRQGTDKIPSFEQWIETEAGGPAGGIDPATLSPTERQELQARYDDQYYGRPHHSVLQRRRSKRSRHPGAFAKGKVEAPVADIPAADEAPKPATPAPWEGEAAPDQLFATAPLAAEPVPKAQEVVAEPAKADEQPVASDRQRGTVEYGRRQIAFTRKGLIGELARLAVSDVQNIGVGVHGTQEQLKAERQDRYIKDANSNRADFLRHTDDAERDALDKEMPEFTAESLQVEIDARLKELRAEVGDEAPPEPQQPEAFQPTEGQYVAWKDGNKSLTGKVLKIHPSGRIQVKVDGKSGKTTLPADTEFQPHAHVTKKMKHTVGRPKLRPETDSLERAIRAMGGIKDDGSGELAKLKASGKPGLVTKDGIEAGEMALRLAGYDYGIGVFAGLQHGNGINVNDFIEAAIEDAAGTRKHYSTQREDPDFMADERADSLARMDAQEKAEFLAGEKFLASPKVQRLMSEVSNGTATAEIIRKINEAGEAYGLQPETVAAEIGFAQRFAEELGEGVDSQEQGPEAASIEGRPLADPGSDYVNPATGEPRFVRRAGALFKRRIETLKEKGYIPIVRRQGARGEPETQRSHLFFSPYEIYRSQFRGKEYAALGVGEYGPNLSTRVIDKTAKIFTAESSYDYLKSKSLHNKSDTLVRQMSKGRYQTLDDVLEEAGGLAPAEIDPGVDLNFRVAQSMAERELRKEGYDGAHWTYEDDLSPEQYQIWNRDVIKRVGEVLTKKQQRELFSRKSGPSKPATGPLVTRDGTRLMINEHALTLLQDAGIFPAGVEGATFGKAYAEIYADRLRQAASKNPQDAKAIRRLARQLVQAGNEAIESPVIMAVPDAMAHELAHESSDRASGMKALKAKHSQAGFQRLTSHPAWADIEAGLARLGYETTDTPLAVEEAYAHIMEGQQASLGLSREQSDNWLDAWFTSLAEAGGDISATHFKEATDESNRIREAAYARQGRPGQSGESVRGVEARREGGDEQADGQGGRQTRTRAFRRWFGDSKVVDAKGEPLVVYHGTSVKGLKGDAFDTRLLGMITKSRSAKAGFYFVDSRDIAEGYSRLANEYPVQALIDASEKAERQQKWTRAHDLIAQAEKLERETKDNPPKEHVVEAYLSIQNPYEFDASEQRFMEIQDEIHDAIEAAKKGGHDGIVFRNLVDVAEWGKNDVADHWLAFDPKQIKSVNNRGTFDPADANILHKRKGKGARKESDTAYDQRVAAALAKIWVNKSATPTTPAPAATRSATRPATTPASVSAAPSAVPTVTALPPPRRAGKHVPGERSFPKTLEEAGFDGGTDRNYEVITDRAAQARASRTIARMGAGRAQAAIREASEPTKHEGTMGIMLIDQFTASGDLRSALEVSNDLSRKFTTAGQLIQSASQIKSFSPTDVLIRAQGQMRGGQVLTEEVAKPLLEQAEATAKRIALLAEIERSRPDIFGPNGEILPPVTRLNETRDSNARPVTRKRARERIGKLADRMASLEEQARARLAARQASGGVKGPEAGATTIIPDIADYAIIGAAKLTRKGISRAVWLAEMAKEVGILGKNRAERQALRDLYRESYRQFEAERAKFRQEARERGAERAFRDEGKGPDRQEPVAGPLRAEDRRKIIQEREAAQKAAQKEMRQFERDFRRLNRTATQRVTEGATGLRRANLLTAAKTHIRNVTSNIAFQGTESVSRPVAAMADMMAMRLKNTGQRTTGGMDIPAEARAIIKAAITEGPRRAADIILGREVLPLEGYGKQKESTQSKMQTGTSDTGIAILDGYINTVFRTLEAEDAIFKVYAFGRELADIARSQALTERAKDKKVKVTERARELRANPTDAMLMEAAAYADYATFQNDNTVSGAIRAGKAFVGPVPTWGVETLAPFDRTPTNILYRTFEYSPLGYISALKKFHNIKNPKGRSIAGIRTERANFRGEIDAITDAAFTRAEQKAFARTFGRATTGTVLAGLALTLAAKGLLIGSADYDDDKAEYFRKRHQFGGGAMLKVPKTDQYIYIGDNPAGKAMGTAAAMYEQITKKKKRGETDAALRDRKLTGAAKSVARLALDQPLMQGTQDLTRGTISEKAGNYVGTMIPGSMALQHIGEVADPEARRTYGEGFTAQIKKVNPLPMPKRFSRRSLSVNTGVNKAERGRLTRRMLRALDPFNTTTEGRGPVTRRASR